ncbi:toll/interleukin-1 receptor domain-containing protein [Bacillus toyonensis]|uniref:toll/interleukin-1 receptor domain-containing protein n=1 Tax=Bacillus toyonensis TaxID=155322 RepID=UPI0015D47268|nr:toll/interleukin-1 receptor domain-containing protein [Bacillus toyonensis]
MKTTPKVFISYAHDTEIFSDKVLSFSNKLRADGIDANIDQYEDSPPEGWPRWMDNQIRTSDYVLVICTPTYLRKINKTEQKTGKGVNWEINIVYQYLYDSYGNNTKFIPIIFDEFSQEDSPVPLRGATFYFPDNPQQYNKLLNRLMGIKSIKKPPLGSIKSLPQKIRKKMFVTSVIDLELWDKAKWKGTLFLFSPKSPPILAILCEDKVAIQGVFGGWKRALETECFFRDMKISLIEGDIPNELEGYYVFISTDVDEFFKRIEKEHSIEENIVTVISRFLRMNPSKGSNNLAIFKTLYQNFGFCYLAPAFIKNKNQPLDSKNIEYDLDYKIKFNNIAFRHIDEIEKDEIESILSPKFKDKLK